MSKELEEAKKYLEQEIKVYDKQHEINKILLNYIDNSIPKEVVVDKIAEQWIKCPKNSINEFAIVERNNKIEVLQELLEGK